MGRSELPPRTVDSRINLGIEDAASCGYRRDAYCRRMRDIDRTHALDQMAVSRETEARFELYVELLQRWQPIKNLIAPSTLDHIWTRHIADSAQLLPLLGQARTVIDLGSGAGFPGLVLAIAKAEQPDFHVHLVESNGRKASFLREAARITQAPATVHALRIEDFSSRWTGKADLVTARALASLSDLLDLSAGFLATGANALFLKGQDAEQELTEAAKYWNIAAELIPSVTDSTAHIILIRTAARRNAVSR
jgi:16S rRNA (guanine527-N7)-methyltransferase